MGGMIIDRTRMEKIVQLWIFSVFFFIQRDIWIDLNVVL